MKYDIKQVNYQGEPDNKGGWWEWKETCDKCGRDCSIDAMTTCKPDLTKPDFCIDCLREMVFKK